MSWNARWKLPPTGAELYMSDGAADGMYKQFLAKLTPAELATYESLLEAQISKVYPDYPKEELLRRFAESKPKVGGYKRRATRHRKERRRTTRRRRL